MKSLVKLYLTEINNGNITIDDVPTKLRKEVEAELAIINDIDDEGE